MKIKKNKSGKITDIGLWFFTILVFGAMMSVIFIVISSFMDAQIEVGNFRLYLIEKRMLLSPNCLAYQEEADDLDKGKTVYGVLDFEKFSEEDFLKGCINDKNIGIKLTLLDQNNKEIYYNEDAYREYNPLSRFDGYLGYESTRFVTLMKGNQKSSEFIQISIATIKEPDTREDKLNENK